MHDETEFESRLLSFAAGGEDSALAAHLESCAECRTQLATVRQLLTYQHTIPGGFAEPPAETRQVMMSLFGRVRPDLVRRQTASLASRWSRLQRVWGQLVLDSVATPHLAGLRSATDRRSRQLAFTSDIADLDLEVTRHGETVAIAGQLGMDTLPDGLWIRFYMTDAASLLEKRSDSVEAEIQPRGHFSLTLHPAEWVAIVELDDALVVFPGVRL